ncbi:MAG: Rrf2 family transcriptional regulator [Candidatus Omnitrophica bacterium]|nr:Rrf2 family transcriptional regulator [Candidatus Omnitrophota bacterium]
MKISTRTRYGTRLMLSLALSYGKGPFLLRDIAKEEQISEKYLSQIVIPLKAKGLVNSFRGAHGGYTLAKAPSQISIKEIVEALEGRLNLIGRIKDISSYSQVSVRVTHNIWNEISEKMAKTLDSITLDDLVKESKAKGNKVLMYNI